MTGLIYALRSTSAQVILEEANALLAEFGDTSMNENENSPSMSSNSSKNSSGLQPSEKGNETSPSSSTSFNRQMAVVPDIDKNEKSSLLDHMETDKWKILCFIYIHVEPNKYLICSYEKIQKPKYTSQLIIYKVNYRYLLRTGL